MKKKPVLILGASSEISLKLAQKFARIGHPLQLAVRSPQGILRNVQDLRVRYSANVNIYELDILNFKSFDAFLDGLVEAPSIIISAIGHLDKQLSDENKFESVKRVVDSNFTGPALLLEKAAHKLSKLQNSVVIIGISSVAGDRGRKKNFWYGAAKAGFTSSLSAMRQKYHKHGVRVITVCPGFVDTKMLKGLDVPKMLTSSPEEVANLILYALENERDIVYSRYWRFIMTVVRLIPENIFKKLNF
ncbi:MAG: short-chain dehydrogenase [Rhodospirillaceae bacterium]|nr:short-chain dehydrogenase [Rhodospirillaceae bacterium]